MFMLAFGDAAPAVSCPSPAGIFSLGTRMELRGQEVSHVTVYRDDRGKRFRIHPTGGGLVCDGPVRWVNGYLRARLRTCLADVGPGIAECWCSPSVVKVRLAKGCNELQGVVRIDGVRKGFSALPGFCGDGLVDWVNDEECDGTNAFFCSPHPCDSECRCTEAGPAR